MLIDPWHIFSSNFGDISKPFTGLATLGDMALYFWVTFRVGRGRAKYKVDAPHTTGPVEFLCIFRVQQNTLEQLMLHLPLLWLAAFAMDDVFAASLGFIWLFARTLYAIRYVQKPSRRFKGFIISMTANILLFIGALVGTLAAFS